MIRSRRLRAKAAAISRLALIDGLPMAADLRPPRRHVESVYHDIVSGRRTGFSAVAARAGLQCLTPFYAAVTAMRNVLFDTGWKRSYAVDVPVISVGNLTVGGTGKTPIVAEIASRLAASGLKPAVVSRGYRSEAGALNDEGEVLRRLVPDATLVQSADRVAAARRAVADMGCRAVVMDDGFQHRRLRRDLDIVLIDATVPWGFGHLLPRGLLRESAQGLRRASLAIITRCDLVDVSSVDKIEQRIAGIHPELEVLRSRFAATHLVNIDGERTPLEGLSGIRVVAACGIGNPTAFERTVTALGALPTLLPFADHHHYGSDDFAAIEAAAERVGADCVLVTIKDLVKIPHSRLGRFPVWGVEIGVQFEGAEDRLGDALDSCLQRDRRAHDSTRQ